MTGVAETGRAAAGWPAGEGRLPFVLRIGVTGHRELADPGSLVPAVRAAIQGLTERLLGPGSGPPLLVISALAEGADRMVAREVLARPDAELEAVLPLPTGEYLADFAAEASRAEFAELLGRAVRVWQAPPGSSREEGYERAGRRVVDRADVLVALWDGQPPRGRGGTAAIVAYARDQGVPVAWVSTTAASPGGRPPGTPRDPAGPVFWYDPERAARIEEAAREFREYNTAAVSEFAAREGAEWERLAPAGGGTGHDGAFSETCLRVGQWIIPYFVRADALATRLERVFNVASWAMFLAAAVAVVIVTAQVAFAPEQTWITALEVLLLLLLVVTPLVSRRRRLLDRWISYRYLAERLRSGYFLALTGAGAGAGDRPTPAGRRERAAYSPDPTEVWLRRALEEIMALRPDVRIGPGDVGPLRDYLCDRWIGAQIRYHEKSARQQGGWDSRLFAVTGVLFAVTAVAAFLHLLGWGEHGGEATKFGLVLVVLSICVPAVGAALHGIRTQSEFRRHAQRYQRMAILLRGLEADLSRAQSIEWIHEIAADAERVMRAENSDWFGVMRLHDVELIT
ncbi:MAG TPA: hypothetical protein VMH35_24565 [Streptosporangiaceae bacterium]|nr:hypothetical protein [Streptosporangiaceae bacterium]